MNTEKPTPLIASGAVGELTNHVAHRVSEFEVQPAELSKLEGQGSIVSTVNADDCLQVRLLYPEGQSAPEQNRRKPTLEDVYLDFFPEGG